jgi:circadian clock protein KaiC
MSARVSTGIAGLDEMLGGGLLPGTCVLLRGAPGTGKTTLGMQYLLHGATRCDEPGLWISFEEFPQSIYRDAESLGWDLRAVERQGQLHLMFTSPEVFLRSLETPDSPLNRLIVEKGVRRVVLDSITHFTRLSDDPHVLRQRYTAAVNGLRREGVTALLLGEEPRGGARAYDDRGRLAFVVDGVILLRYVEIESAIQRALLVLKLRGSGHAKEIRHYEIRQKDGLVVTGTFERREGLLSGMPRRV